MGRPHVYHLNSVFVAVGIICLCVRCACRICIRLRDQIDGVLPRLRIPLGKAAAAGDLDVSRCLSCTAARSGGGGGGGGCRCYRVGGGGFGGGRRRRRGMCGWGGGGCRCRRCWCLRGHRCCSVLRCRRRGPRHVAVQEEVRRELLISTVAVLVVRVVWEVLASPRAHHFKTAADSEKAESHEGLGQRALPLNEEIEELDLCPVYGAVLVAPVFAVGLQVAAHVGRDRTGGVGARRVLGVGEAHQRLAAGARGGPRQVHQHAGDASRAAA